MSINLLIGKINKDGTVDAITVRRDGGIDHKRCLYKYYRSPERVSALIRNGITRDPLAIYINENEMEPSSPLYNEEVTMLPTGIGFPDDDFYETMDPNQNLRRACQYPSVEEFFKDAERVDFYDDDVFLYNPEKELWTGGKTQTPLRELIIAEWQENYYDNPEWASESFDELIEQMDAIDQFIAKRKQQKSAPEVTGAPQATDELETQIEEEQPVKRISGSLENANIYLFVVEQIGYEQRERKIVNLPITKELENMKVSEIAPLIGVKNATVEIYHDKEAKKPASYAYLSTWVPFAEEVTVKKYAIFSLMESIENHASMIRTMKMTGSFVDERRKQEVLAELAEKENLALNALRTVMDEDTLKVAAERIRRLSSLAGIYDLIDELGIQKNNQEPEQTPEVTTEESELPHILQNVNLYLKVRRFEPGKVYYHFLPITQEIENMKICDIPAYLGYENASIEVCHSMYDNSNVSSAFLWANLSGETRVIDFTIFSLLEAFKNIDVKKERQALEVLSKIIDKETLEIAIEQVIELPSPVGIYNVMRDLGIPKTEKKSEKKL